MYLQRTNGDRTYTTCTTMSRTNFSEFYNKYSSGFSDMFNSILNILWELSRKDGHPLVRRGFPPAYVLSVVHVGVMREEQNRSFGIQYLGLRTTSHCPSAFEAKLLELEPSTDGYFLRSTVPIAAHLRLHAKQE